MSSFKLGKWQSSVVKRVTLWYSLFIAGLVVAIMVLALMISGTVSTHTTKLKLIEEAIEMSLDIDDFEDYDDGIYYLLYDSDQSLIAGRIPEDFDRDLPLAGEDLQTLTVNQKQYAYYDVAVPETGQWLRAVSLVSVISDDMRTFLLILGIGLPVFVLAVTGGGYLILKKAFQPIKTMVTTAQTISRDRDYSQRIPNQSKDRELTELATTLNQMLGSVEEAFQRERQFNNDVSHELRTPLSVILAESDYGLHYVTDLVEAREGYQTIHRQAQRMQALVEQILELARADNRTQLHLEPLDLSALVTELAQDYQGRFSQADLDLILDLPPTAPVLGEKLLLQRLLDNLLTNAIRYAKSQVGVSLREEAGQLCLTVSDDGLGIAPEHQEKIWHRFFQVDAARNQTNGSNSGLGLALVKRIADLHGASLQLESELGQGAKFRVGFPKVVAKD